MSEVRECPNCLSEHDETGCPHCTPQGDEESCRQAPTEAPTEKIEASKAYSETIPVFSRDLYVRTIQKEVSPRLAIKANCQFCVGYEETVTRIRDCSVYKCPLWTYRPYQSKSTTERKNITQAGNG